MIPIHTFRPNLSKILAAFVLLICAASLSAGKSAENSSVGPEPDKVASVQEMLAARTDVWGDAAMRQPNGASYEFFKDLLPPVRWANAEFRYYPIVLSAPRAAQKARLVSNGSSVNAHGNKPPMKKPSPTKEKLPGPYWKDIGVPINFFVGEPAESFGGNFSQLQEPSYLDGYLPVVTIAYKSGSTTYREESLAPVDEASAAHGTALLRFSAESGGSKAKRVEARIDTKDTLRVQNYEVLDSKGQCLVSYEDGWRWDGVHKALVAELRDGEKAELAIYTKPVEAGHGLSLTSYEKNKADCVATWKKLIGEGVKLDVPERIVNDAWRSLVIGNLIIAVGDRPHYSAANAYDHLYEGECGDTVRSLVLFGQKDVLPGMLKSMLEFNRKDTQFHVAGQKLQLLSYLYWLTRDAAMIRELEPLWRQSVDLILNNREKESGLLPKDRYAGDIATKVYSLNSNANCWRGLRDLVAVLEEIGSHDEAKKLREFAADYRKSILRAVDRSERRETKPPYIPIALLADEQPPEPLTSSEFGSYYDLICPYMIDSQIFGEGSERENWLISYLQQHGGIGSGMMRTERHTGQNKGSKALVPLYALRYNLALFRRVEREKALVGVYGQLAFGMTRGTFIGGEANRILFHGDENGREFVLPPNSTNNATFLILLRYMLVQDWDLNEDSIPETLRLMYGVPRAWLADGKKVQLQNAPTAFGPITLKAESKLHDGYVDLQVTPPPRPVKTMLLRAPLPAGWQSEGVEVDGRAAKLLEGNAVDLSGKTGQVRVRFSVKAVAEGR